jgi:hypothetical protein
MSRFTTCELCEVVFNAETSNAATNPHRCEPADLVTRIVALKEALKSERKRSQPKQGCGHTVDCAVHSSPGLPSEPCDCGAALGVEEHPALMLDTRFNRESENVSEALSDFQRSSA